MNCLIDDTALKHRNRVNANTRTIVFEYFHCDKCGKDYDKDKNEIIIKGLGYILKKDSITPDPMM